MGVGVERKKKNGPARLGYRVGRRWGSRAGPAPAGNRGVRGVYYSPESRAMSSALVPLVEMPSSSQCAMSSALVSVP